MLMTSPSKSSEPADISLLHTGNSPVWFAVRAPHVGESIHPQVHSKKEALHDPVPDG